jgi:glucose-6-phosphate isomerase
MSLFSSLEKHVKTLQDLSLIELRQRENGLLKNKIIALDGLEADFSKHYATRETYKIFENIASQLKLSERIEAMISGNPIKFTEGRAALRTAY